MRGGSEEIMCGGTSRDFDQNAPKEIVSGDMVLFNIKCRLPRVTFGGDRKVNYPRLFEISCFAAKTEAGTFILYDKITEPRSRRDPESPFEAAFIADDPLPALCEIVKEYKMAEENGRHSFTHGLPEDFGGSIDIRFSSGEYISISNNQSPIISREAGEAIAALFEKLLKKGKRVSLPDPGTIVGICFEEKRSSGGFTKAVLALNADGGCTLARSSKYDGPTVYNSEKKTDGALLDFARKSAAEGVMLAWRYLPESGFTKFSEKSMTFVLEDGGEITVPDDRLLPDRLRSHFFNIELELTTKA